MLATLTDDYFSDPEWIYEPKLDGIRCLAFKSGRSVRLMSRNKLEMTGSYPDVVAALKLQKGDFVCDGEVAAVAADGVTSFSLLQQARLAQAVIRYFVFDLVHSKGVDLRPRPVLERKAELERRIEWREPLDFVSHIEEEGEAYLQKACEKGMEGIIAKRAPSKYVGGRARDWLKFKCTRQQELVIAGYTDPQGARTGFGALLVGYYGGAVLRYAGRVGTGFARTTIEQIMKKLKPLEVESSAFVEPPPIRRGVHWVKPKLVAQVGFAEWTGDGRLRHPRFLGLRTDKSAREVRREN